MVKILQAMNKISNNHFTTIVILNVEGRCRIKFFILERKLKKVKSTMHLLKKKLLRYKSF